jgi:hypothetical protein
MNKDCVTCMICGKEAGIINYLHLRLHKITTKEYVDTFPNSPLCSKSSLKKRSETSKGRKISEETKKKISESNKLSWENNPNQGRTGCPLSEESKKVVSKKLIGHFVSEETRGKIGLSGIGREPWNKGLTKYDDERIMGVSNRVRDWNINFMTDEIKNKISQTLKMRYANGMKIPNSKNSYREDLKMSLRSSWEANYARILKFNNKKIEYEFDKFVLYQTDGSIEVVYTPDFKIDDKTYIELKGHADGMDEWGCTCKRCLRDKNKLLLMTEQYSEIKIILIARKEYQNLCQKYHSIISDWEFTRWDDANYVWKKEK